MQVRRATGFLFIVVLLPLLAACAGKPFVGDRLTPGELAADARLGVLPVNYIDKPSMDVHDNIVGLAGTAGKLAVAKGRDTKRRKLTEMLAGVGFVYQERADAFLIERLVEAGLDAEFIAFRRSIDNVLGEVPPRRFEKRYPANSGYDVLLDLYVDYVGYAAVGLDDDYLPTVHIAARLVNGNDLSVLYESRIQYNPLEAKGEETVIDADPEYAFKDFDALIAEPERARDGLRQAIVAVVDRLAGDLSARP